MTCSARSSTTPPAPFVTLPCTDGGTGGHPQGEAQIIRLGRFDVTSWFRSWHGAPTDTKWLTIARRAGVAPGIVSAVAWALLDYASQHLDRGCVDGFDVETYAAFSGFEEADIQAVIDAMTSKQMIVSGRLASWEKRQPEREDNSAERVRRYRESRNGTGVTPDDVTQCNAETRIVTRGNAPDTDTDTDTEEVLTAYAVSAPAEQPMPEQAPKPKRTGTKKPTDANMQHPAVIAFRDIAQKFPNHVQAQAIATTVTDVPLWQSTVTRWLTLGWSPVNIDGMLMRYTGGWGDIDAKRSGQQRQQAEQEPRYKQAIRAFIQREGLVPNGI